MKYNAIHLTDDRQSHRLAQPRGVIERMVKATGSRANGEHTVDLFAELSEGQNSWCSATVALGNRRCHLHLRLFLQRQVHLCNCKHGVSQNAVASGEGWLVCSV